MKSPEAVTVQKAGYMRETHARTILFICFLVMPCTGNRRSLSWATESNRRRKSSPKASAFRQLSPCWGAHLEGAGFDAVPGAWSAI